MAFLSNDRGGEGDPDVKTSFLMDTKQNAWHTDEEAQKLDLDTDGSSSGGSPDKMETRHQWKHKMEYFLSMIGYCVGLGNIWRFPYICIRNGGGAFLIPFFICLFVCGLPLYFMEVAMGQFVSRSCYHVWAICPLFKGVGIAMIVLVTVCSWYYIMILDWTLIFLVNSFKSPLPWTVCGQSWNTEHCVPTKGRDAENASLLVDATLGQGLNLNDSVSLADNGTFKATDGLLATANSTLTNLTVTSKSSTEEFWTNNVLHLSDGLHDMGGLSLQSSLSLFVVSVIVFLCLWKGIKSVGKVVYVTATLPYVLIFILLIKGVTLPGAWEGILFYIRPDFSKLLKITTWLEASVQVFYSLGPAWGNLISMASYNKFKNNCMSDSIILSIICEGTSVFTGMVTFSFLGHMSYRLDIPVANFSTSGAGLAFVVYPEAISYLPLPQLWGVLFFLMLMTVGLDTQFVCVETFLTFITDMFPKFMKKWNLLAKSIILCVLFFLGLIFCTSGGMYIFQLVDWYIGAFTVICSAIIECTVVAWVYGADRFCKDVELMIGQRPWKIFPFLWRFVTPALLTVVCISTLAFYEAPSFEGYTYGSGAVAFGWIIAFVSFVPIPVVIIYTLAKSEGSLRQRLRSSCKPTDQWVPADPVLKEQYLHDNRDFEPFQISLSCRT